MSRQLTPKKSLLIILGVTFLVVAVGAGWVERYHIRATAQAGIAHMQHAPKEAFPAVDTTHLNDIQKQVVSLAKQEYALKPVSFDSRVLVYTQGAKEAWCADFASWVYKQVGVPMSNPNSGSWRIPGVYTMQEYFQAEHRYHAASSSYTPQTGDIAVYSRGQGHVAIVLAAKDGVITTIGGNEGGRMRISTAHYKDPSAEVLGFGAISTD